jgi:hypothetical protein
VSVPIARESHHQFALGCPDNRGPADVPARLLADHAGRGARFIFGQGPELLEAADGNELERVDVGCLVGAAEHQLLAIQPDALPEWHPDVEMLVGGGAFVGHFEEGELRLGGQLQAKAPGAIRRPGLHFDVIDAVQCRVVRDVRRPRAAVKQIVVAPGLAAQVPEALPALIEQDLVSWRTAFKSSLKIGSPRAVASPAGSAASAAAAQRWSRGNSSETRASWQDFMIVAAILSSFPQFFFTGTKMALSK